MATSHQHWNIQTCLASYWDPYGPMGLIGYYKGGLKLQEIQRFARQRLSQTTGRIARKYVWMFKWPALPDKTSHNQSNCPY